MSHQIASAAVTAALLVSFLTVRSHAQQDPVDLSAKLTLQHYLRASAAVAGAERDAQLALTDGQPASVYLDRARAIISTRDDLDRAINDLRELDRTAHSIRTK